MKTPVDSTCGTCGRLMSDDPRSGDALNCGGDCLGCVREAEKESEES